MEPSKDVREDGGGDIMPSKDVVEEGGGGATTTMMETAPPPGNSTTEAESSEGASTQYDKNYLLVLVLSVVFLSGTDLKPEKPTGQHSALLIDLQLRGIPAGW